MEGYEPSFFWFCFWVFLVEYLWVCWIFGVQFFRASWKAYEAHQLSKGWAVERGILIFLAFGVVFTPITWPFLVLIRLIGGKPPLPETKK
jgi:hypothetical protein